MRITAMWCVAALLFALLLTSRTSVQARGQAAKPTGSLPGTFTFIPKVSIEKVQQAIENKAVPNDAPVRMVDAGKFNLGVYTLNTEPTPPRPASPSPVFTTAISPKFTCSSAVRDLGALAVTLRTRPRNPTTARAGK